MMKDLPPPIWQGMAPQPMRLEMSARGRVHNQQDIVFEARSAYHAIQRSTTRMNPI